MTDEDAIAEETRAERRRSDRDHWTWLVRELILYRGLVLFLLIVSTGTTLTTYLVDQRRHDTEEALRLEERNLDNKERALHWTKLEDGVSVNNRDIGHIDLALRACITCHAHPNLDQIISAGEKKIEPK